jgi:hypothetical protein
MKFVLVNGRTPFCAPCCKSIGESYLRDIAARLGYCNHDSAAKFPFLHCNIVRWHHDNSPDACKTSESFCQGAVNT